MFQIYYIAELSYRLLSTLILHWPIYWTIQLQNTSVRNES